MQNFEGLLHFWNNTLPSFVHRCWPLYGQALEEGCYFIKRPMLSAFLPFVFLGGGFLIGGWHLGYQSVLTELLFLMILVVFLSFLNTQWGALWWAGYCLGDFLLFRMHTITLPYQGIFPGILKVGLPSIIYYALLVLLVVYIPLLTKLLVQKTLGKGSFQNNKIGNAILHGFLSGGFVYFWNQAYPLLIRPVWTWYGYNPAVQAIEPIQKTGWVLVLCAVFASVARILLKDRMRQRVWGKKELPLSLWQSRIKIPLPIQILLKTIFTTFLLSGLLVRWWDALILLLVLLLLYSLRAGFYLKFPSAWIQWLEAIPLLIRLAIAIGISLLLADPIHRALWHYSQNTFLPIIVTFSLSLFLIYLICPNKTQRKHETSR